MVSDCLAASGNPARNANESALDTFNKKKFSADGLILI